MMQIYKYIYIAALVALLFSCKSQRDVSRSAIKETRVESLVTTNDSIKTHRETSHNVDEVKTETTTTYSKRTEFAPDNSVVSIIETWSNINFKVDFKSNLKDITREDFKYNSATQITDTTSQIINEVVKETKDSRPMLLQWFAFILTVGVVVVFALYIVVKFF